MKVPRKEMKVEKVNGKNKWKPMFKKQNGEYGSCLKVLKNKKLEDVEFDTEAEALLYCDARYEAEGACIVYEYLED